MESLLTFHLLSQGAAAAQEHSPGGSLEQCAILGRNEISSENKHAAERFLPLLLQARLAGPDLGLQSILEVLRVGRRLFVQDHEIHRQLFHPPVFVRAKQLTYDILVFSLIDANKHDWQITGNPVSPQSRRPPVITCEHRR